MLKKCFSFLYKKGLVGNKTENKKAYNHFVNISPSDIIETFDTIESPGTNDNNSTIGSSDTSHDTLIGNRKWIRQYKSDSEFSSNFDKDIVRQYSCMSSKSLSSLDDSHYKTTNDICRVSLENIRGPIIPIIKNTYK